MKRVQPLVLCLLLSACVGGGRVVTPGVLSREGWQEPEVAEASTVEREDVGGGIRADLGAAAPTVGRDLVSVFGSLGNWGILLGQYFFSEYTDSLGLEEPTERYFDRHTVYSNGVSSAVENLGQGYVLLAGAAGLYVWGDAQDDGKAVASSKLLLRSLTTTGISTITIKSFFKDDRPNGGTNAYPSGHTSMSVTAATSLWYSYGPKVGVPATLLASAVALQRLDSKAHSLDDVIGGAGLGWLVARTLARQAPLEVFGANVLPYVGDDGTTGISLLWSR